MTTDDEIRDADGCEDYESLEESGLHDTAETPPAQTETAEQSPDPENPETPENPEDDGEAPFGETDDGEPDIPEEAEEPEAENPLAEELAAANDKYMRLFAEFDNFRKRTAKEKSETYLDAVAKTVGELLPMIDSFSLAMAAACTDEAYRTGIEKTYEQLQSILSKLGVTEAPGVGQPFDPKLHNAIQQIDSPDFEEGTVCTVYQKGYLLGDRIIRCAMVAVAN